MQIPRHNSQLQTAPPLLAQRSLLRTLAGLTQLDQRTRFIHVLHALEYRVIEGIIIAQHRVAQLRPLRQALDLNEQLRLPQRPIVGKCLLEARLAQTTET